MDGPWSKNNPDSISITHQPLLARCQRAPHPGQVNEIRCKCRYNGAFLPRTNYTVSTSLPARRIRQPVNDRGIQRGVCAQLRASLCACHEAIRLFPRLICSVEAQLLACLSVCPFGLLTTHLMSPLRQSCRLIPPPPPPPLRAATATMWEGKI